MRCNSQTRNLLRDVADFRLVTTSQIAHLREYGSQAAARRAMRSLQEKGLVALLPGASEGGRPENVYGLAKRGYDILVDDDTLSRTVPYDKVSGETILHQLSHQFLLNWTRVNIIHACRHIHRIECHFLASNSPFALWSMDESPIVPDEVTLPGNGRTVGLVPDAAFVLKHKRSTEAVLFLLEVDMGTEPLTRTDGITSNIRDKVERYKAYFRSDGYRKYESLWDVPLRGFRTLFLANDSQRARQISDFLRTVKPCGFCWVTSQDRITEEGISANIWTPGGDIDKRDSIFDMHACILPLPSIPD